MLAQDAGRAALSGAGDAAGDGGRRLHARRGRPAAPRDGGLATAGPDRRSFATSCATACWLAASPPSSPTRSIEQIRGFGEYGFPESHAASFALLVYVSAWLKCHYPAAFAAALLNSQPMGFYAPAQIVRDAVSHGVPVRAVDVNHSDWDCTLEDPLTPTLSPEGRGNISVPPSPLRGEGTGVRGKSPALRPSHQPSPQRGEGEKALRLGFRLIKGLPQTAGNALAEARGTGAYRSITDCARRTRLGRATLARLAAADAFGSLGLSRRTALWHVLSAGEELPLFAGLEEEHDTPALPQALMGDEVVADYDSIGLSLKAHPIGLLRRELTALEVTTSAELMNKSDKDIVRVAGLVLVRQAPVTAKGVIFVTLEDETGPVNLVVWANVWNRYRRIANSAVALLVQGRVQIASGVIHVVALRLEDLSEALQGITSRSRDFR